MNLSGRQMLDRLRKAGCTVGGVTRGEHGLLWYEGDGGAKVTPALAVPSDKVIDTSGAGDIFHGAYLWSRLMRPEQSWNEHFKFASAASAYKVQKLGNEAGLPTQADIARMRQMFTESEARPA